MKTFILVVLALACASAIKSTSQSSMQSTGPADVLLDHLSMIQNDIRQEQLEHDKLYEEQHQECEDEFEARTVAVTDGESALKRATAHHARCEAAYTESEADLAQVRAYQTEIDGILQGLKLKREQQKADYQVFVNDELDPAIAAVRGAYPIIDDFVVGGSFVEMTRHMGKSFKALVKIGRGAQMAAPLSALVELGQEFDQNAVNQVRELFQKLEADLVQAKQDATDTENHRAQVYVQNVETYEQILQNLANTEQELIAYSADMAACVVQESGIIEQASAKVKNNKEALAYAIQMCGAFEEEYKNASDGRKAELELLEKLYAFVQEQAEIFGDYGADNTGVFDQYKNQYEQGLANQVQGFIQMRAQKNKEHLMRLQQALH